MPRLTIKHENTIMYKLVCNDVNIKELYVGQTTNFTVRKDSHKTKCSNELLKSYNLKVYKFIHANGGWDNWSMIEIEKYACVDSKEARKRERYWMETLHATLNCQTPSRTRSEYYLEKLAEQKMYKLANKEKIAEYQKIYREANKEQLAEQKKIYRETNREQIADYNKTHYLANKEQLKEQRSAMFDCPCGGKYSHGDKSRHFKTQRHSTYIENTQSQSLAI
jgi:hypothetical protein